MEFKLRWENPNTFATVVKVYRGTAPLVFANLANPVATLSNGETEWTDRDLVYGNTYYYMLTVTANGQTIPTLNQSFKAVNRRGIGPETIMYGDDRFGYMGAPSYDETMDLKDLFASLNLVIGAGYAGVPTLHKWIRNGKILYTMQNFRYTSSAKLTWDALYQAGMVFGTDDAGPEDRRGNNPPIEQSAGMIHLGDRYRVRLPRGITDDEGNGMIDFATLSQPISHDDIPNTVLDEFTDIGYQYQPFFPEKMRFMRFVTAGYNPNNNYIASGNNSYLNYGFYCQERDVGESGKLLVRAVWPASSTPADATHVSMVSARDPASLHWWAPIIELVEE